MAEGRPVRAKRKPSVLKAYESSPLSDADPAYDQDLSPPQHAGPASPPPPPVKRAARKSTSRGLVASGLPETSPAAPVPARRASTRRQSSGPAGAAVSPVSSPSEPKPAPKARAPPKKRTIAKVRSESEDEDGAAPALAAGLAETAALPEALPALPTAAVDAGPALASTPVDLVAPSAVGALSALDGRPTPSTPTDQPPQADRKDSKDAPADAPFVPSPAERFAESAETWPSVPQAESAVQGASSTASASGPPALLEATPSASQPPVPSGSTLTPLSARPPSPLSAILGEPQAGNSPVSFGTPLALPTEAATAAAAPAAPLPMDVHPSPFAMNKTSTALSPAPAPILSPANLPLLPVASPPTPAESTMTPPAPAPAPLPTMAGAPAKKDESNVKSRARTAATVAAAGGGSSGSTPVRKKPKLSSAVADAAAAGEGQAKATAAQAEKGSAAGSTSAMPGGTTPSAAKPGGSGLAAKGGALGRIPSMKKVGGGEQAKTQTPASTPKAGGFDIMRFKQKKDNPTTLKAAATMTKRPAETKVVKESSTLMTHEQRRQEFLKRRDIERAERSAAEKDSLDLLEQIKGMQEFETAYRLQVRQLIEAEKPRVKDDIRLMLPRLSTFGSVFSLFPRKE
ncbi:proteophosphoglycan ppg4 [Rhodotorula toruloides]|uniref:Proteophosphoglycan ppg4 n=1 Tax=Rhodotorula toruloides TaxID=5286 RepID=A0A511KSA0_RHOTO|nr:proteophosphoglycan ppg4 [Rhodotorula toruloides]